MNQLYDTRRAYVEGHPIPGVHPPHTSQRNIRSLDDRYTSERRDALREIGIEPMLLQIAALAAAPQSYDACAKQAAGVMPALKVCAAREQSARDADLNRTYQGMLKELDPASQQKLRTAERAWIAYRDAECKFRLAAEGGGQDGALVWSDCKLELTSQRITQLKRK